ncbi:MAG: hypothetical protein BWY82_02311 [Verrucomicrobia bacterium ADurb.Bin474]|nr:MAG: hypothetical protein BWY82_02311 [Verrucomicrobia bacterium ADurb.Bin474]
MTARGDFKGIRRCVGRGKIQIGQRSLKSCDGVWNQDFGGRYRRQLQRNTDRRILLELALIPWNRNPDTVIVADSYRVTQDRSGNRYRKTVRNDLKNQQFVPFLSIIIDGSQIDHFRGFTRRENDRTLAFELSIFICVRIFEILIKHSRARGAKAVGNLHFEQRRTTQLEHHVNVLSLIDRLTSYIKRNRHLSVRHGQTGKSRQKRPTEYRKTIHLHTSNFESLDNGQITIPFYWSSITTTTHSPDAPSR